MQSSHSYPVEERTKANIHCAGDMIEPRAADRDTAKTKTVSDAKTDGKRIPAPKSHETTGKAKVCLEKQHAIVKDMDELQSSLPKSATSLRSPVKYLLCGLDSGEKEYPEHVTNSDSSKGHDIKTSENPSGHGKIEAEKDSKKINKIEAEKESKKMNKHASSSVPLPSPTRVVSQQLVIDETCGKNAQPGSVSLDKNKINDGKENKTAKCSSSGGMPIGTTVQSATTTSVGSSVSCVNSGSGSNKSAASRRSNFFNEPSRTAETGTAFKHSSSSSGHIPVSMVTERAKQFEKAIARKGGIEVKSRSLDPPYSSDAIASQAAVYERLVAGNQPSSAPPGNVAQTADSLLRFDNSHVNSDILPEHAPRTRRASNDQFETPGIKNNTCHNEFDQSISQDLMPGGTPVAKSGNIQKLKAFFGETTPKIIEAKAGTRSVMEESTGDGATDAIFPETKKDGIPKYDASAAQKSLTFDPASWALERMARGKKAAGWTLASRSHGSHSPGCNAKERPKKSSTERDPSSSPKQKEHKTWKDKMGKTFKRYGSGTTAPDVECFTSEEVTGTFGIPLELLPPSLVNELVPSVVEMCTRVVEEKALDNQGIYRVPGNSGALNAMIDELNKDPHGLCTESDKWLDVNLVSSMLKLFFRKLPDPLITDELYEAIITANRTENSERRMLKLKKLIHDLPEHNFETLRFLAQHLNKVASHEEVNKMDAHNLAIVFGPTLVRPQEDTMVVMVRDMADQCRVVESIIVHCDWFFSSWDEDVYVPVDEEAEDATPISGMNQELLAKAERLDLPCLPRDSRCKEFVSSFLQAANRKIYQSKRRRQSDSHELAGCSMVHDGCPSKKFRKSDKKDTKGPLRHYLSERKIAQGVKTLTVKNFRSHSALQDAPQNTTQYPVGSTFHGKLSSIENTHSTLFHGHSPDPFHISHRSSSGK